MEKTQPVLPSLYSGCLCITLEAKAESVESKKERKMRRKTHTPKVSVRCGNW